MAPIKQIANESFDIDTQDVETIIELVKEKRIDGIFVGASEENMIPAITVSEKTEARFYTTREQWELLSNKRFFMEYAQKHNIPTPKNYTLTEEFRREELDRIKYPVIVKPTDGSGAKGLNACYNEKELIYYYKEAMKYSPKKDVIVEELITDSEEVFFIYTIQNGKGNLSAAFTKSVVKSEKHYVSLPIFHIYPSRYIDEFMENVNDDMQNMFQDIGLKNGVISLQGFHSKNGFCFFEAGYRMGGEQMYVLTEKMNGTNSLHMMLNLVLCGKMEEYDIAEKDSARFPYPCCNYYVPLKSGVISQILGLGEVEKMPQVLNVTRIRFPGDVIDENNSLGRVALRLHVWDETPEKLASTLEKLSAMIRILDENGNEMQIEHLTYARCLETIMVS